MTYDFVFVTHLPSFYKVNLYERLSENYKVAAIYLGGGSEERNSDFGGFGFNFDQFYLSDGDFESRERLKCLYKLSRILRQITYKKIIVGGWEHPEFWYSVIKSGRMRSALALEATVFESNLGSLHVLIKSVFCKLISMAFPSGTPHSLLLRVAGFRGKQIFTNGVGLLNPRLIDDGVDADSVRKGHFSGKLLYVGRLSDEKNVEFLINRVKSDKRLSLKIVGTGPSMSKISEQCGGRIEVVGYVNNSELSAYYRDADVLVLPSNRETWGLVVEEAALNGCPCLVSSIVGCSLDLVYDEGIGFVYKAGSIDSFNSKINTLFESEEDFSRLVANCTINNYLKRERKQLAAYYQALEGEVA